LKTDKKWNASILILVLGFVISGCGTGQIIYPTPKPATLPPIQEITPTQILTSTQIPTPTQILTPTLTLTASPTLTTTPIPSLPPGVENFFHVEFNNTISFTTDGLSFTNHEVNGVSHWATHLQNMPDDSHAPVYGLGLEFDAKIDKIGNNIMQKNLVSAGYPNYKWFFGNVPEEPLREVYMSEGYIESADGIPFTPGFDASISIDKTTFSTPDKQTITITIIPRVPMTFPGITVHTQGGPNGNSAEANIADILPGDHKGLKGEIVSVSPDGKNLFVNNMQLVVNQPYSFSFSVNVQPGGSGINYQPYVSISWCPRVLPPDDALGNGKKQGSMFAVTIDRVGTWTWTANGEYQIEWHTGNVYMVNFGG
jgi:hypothetical protein